MAVSIVFLSHHFWRAYSKYLFGYHIRVASNKHVVHCTSVACETRKVPSDSCPVKYCPSVTSVNVSVCALWQRGGDRVCSCTCLNMGIGWCWIGQLQFPSALYPETFVRYRLNVWLGGPQPVWSVLRWDTSLGPAENRNTIPRTLSPWYSHHTDWAIRLSCTQLLVGSKESPVETWWHTVTHGRGSEGETGEWSG
jgi:hypothetical protein